MARTLPSGLIISEEAYRRIQRTEEFLQQQAERNMHPPSRFGPPAQSPARTIPSPPVTSTPPPPAQVHIEPGDSLFLMAVRDAQAALDAAPIRRADMDPKYNQPDPPTINRALVEKLAADGTFSNMVSMRWRKTWRLAHETARSMGLLA